MKKKQPVRSLNRWELLQYSLKRFPVWDIKKLVNKKQRDYFENSSESVVTLKMLKQHSYNIDAFSNNAIPADTVADTIKWVSFYS